MQMKFYIISLFWGGLWAGFLQFSRFGRFLVHKRTWVTVVVGVGGDLIILLFLIPFRIWLKFFTIIALSSVPIIYRSLSNELHETLEEINVIKR